MSRLLKLAAISVLDKYFAILITRQTHFGVTFDGDQQSFRASNGVLIVSAPGTGFIWTPEIDVLTVLPRENYAYLPICVTASDWDKIARAVAEYNFQTSKFERDYWAIGWGCTPADKPIYYFDISGDTKYVNKGPTCGNYLQLIKKEVEERDALLAFNMSGKCAEYDVVGFRPLQGLDEAYVDSLGDIHVVTPNRVVGEAGYSRLILKTKEKLVGSKCIGLLCDTWFDYQKQNYAGTGEVVEYNKKTDKYKVRIWANSFNMVRSVQPISLCGLTSYTAKLTEAIRNAE